MSYTYSTSQFGPAIIQVLYGLMWLVATILDSAGLYIFIDSQRDSWLIRRSRTSEMGERSGRKKNVISKVHERYKEDLN